MGEVAVAEYDLVIVGNSYVARWAALRAAQQSARVALVLHGTDPVFPLVIQALADVLAIAAVGTHSLPFATVGELRHWLGDRSQTVLRPYALTRLTEHGVDVIPVPGQFIAPPPQKRICQSAVFAVQDRQLRSHRYLLALPQSSTLSDVLELLDRVETESVNAPNFKVCLNCYQPWVITIGQALQHIGYPVTLACEKTLLPFEDPDVDFFVQCALEADGFRIEPEIIELDGESNRLTDSVGEAVCFTSMPEIDLRQLGLIHTKIAEDKKLERSPLPVTPTFQTQDRRIYACGAILGGYLSPRISQREMAIALDNTLFSTKEKQNYLQWAYSLPLGLGFCRIGLTEPQARRNYAHIEVMTRALESEGHPFFCKLVATTSGEIVGIHGVGGWANHAADQLESILKQHRFISQLSHVHLNNLLLTQVLHDFAHRWRQVKFPQVRDRHERYFRAKRKRFS